MSREEFDRVIAENPMVVADFYSTECPPCEALSPVCEIVSEKYPQVKFVKIMRQNNRELAESLFVMSSPTLLFYRDGNLLERRLSGRILDSELESVLNDL